MSQSTIQRFIFPICVFLTLIIICWGFFWFGTEKWYREYLSQWEYRRLHPELIPSVTTVKLFDMGHTTSYASLTWLELIQYIGDNVWWNKFLNFSHRMLENITTLHPYFIRAYEIDLILAPTSLGENINPEVKKQNKIYSNNAINLWKKGMEILCDKSKIEEIRKKSPGEKLWNDESLKNPCASGTLPYYIAFVTYQMGDKKAESAEYYKIASMNEDAPNASRLLWILALSAEWDYRASALNFALIGSTGYDVEPYACRNLAIDLVDQINKKRILNNEWIKDLVNQKNNLKNNKDPKNIISTASDNCHDMTTRAIETLYLNYTADLAKGTEAKNEDNLIAIGLLKNTETDAIKKWFTTYEKDWIWQYRPKVNQKK